MKRKRKTKSRAEQFKGIVIAAARERRQEKKAEIFVEKWKEINGKMKNWKARRVLSR
jgi:hypothetical protein